MLRKISTAAVKLRLIPSATRHSQELCDGALESGYLSRYAPENHDMMESVESNYLKATLNKLSHVSPEEAPVIKNSFEIFVWPLLRVAQILGLYPLEIDKQKEAKICPKSSAFVYSIFLVIVRFGGAYWSGSDAFTSLVRNFISSPTEEIFYAGTIYWNVIYQLIHTANTFLSLKVLLEIHKAYREFSRSFSRCFLKMFAFEVAFMRNLAVAFVAVPVVSFVTQFCWRPETNGSWDNSLNFGFAKILEIFFAILMVMSLIVEDCKLIINCLCITHGFRRCNREIVKCLEDPMFTVSQKTLSEWKNLYLLLNKLSVLTGSMTMLIQLTCIAQEIFLVTGLLYFNIAGLINGSKSIYSYGTILPCVMIVWHSLRQYVKFNIANSIIEESTALVNYLRKTDRSKLDLRTKEAFYDFTIQLMRNPASINFGKYFTLSKASLFSVAGRVITYLIVVIQFQATSK